MIQDNLKMRVLTCFFCFLITFSVHGQTSGTLVTASGIDVNKDGTNDRVELVMTSGKLYHDTEKWCGSGVKYEGQFSLVIKIGDNTKRYSVNELFNPDIPDSPIWFSSGFNSVDSARNYSEPRGIQFEDYNNDGQLDFTLGQYRGCNGWTYRLFTIDDKGSVSLLNFACSCHEQLYISRHMNSIKLEKTSGGFAVEYYNNSIGHFRDRFIWLADRFILVERVRPEK